MNLENMSDEEIVDFALEKNKLNEATTIFYKRYSNNLEYKLTGFVGKDNAKDVLHDVFLRIQEKLPLYRNSEGKFSTWLFKSAKNLAIDEIRKNSKRFCVKNISLCRQVKFVLKNVARDVGKNYPVLFCRMGNFYTEYISVFFRSPFFCSI